VTEILTEPVSAPNVWRGDELAEDGRWVIRLTEEDLADFERALAHVSANHLEDVTRIRAEDFPLPHFQERIDDIVNRLEHGLGFVLLRGLPIYDRFSVAEATIIYWATGRHMGNLVPQNRRGDLIGQIRDLGRRGPYERAYATNEDLGFHTDSTDFVGLMCLRPALCGGRVSSPVPGCFCVRRRRRGPSTATTPAAAVDQPAQGRPAPLPRVRGLAQRVPDVTGASQRDGRKMPGRTLLVAEVRNGYVTARTSMRPSWMRVW
jgi:Taurine catabolism dioxygenase TauD, TfdA family